LKDQKEWACLLAREEGEEAHVHSLTSQPESVLIYLLQIYLYRIQRTNLFRKTAVDKARRTIVMDDSVSRQTLEAMKRYYQALGSEYDKIINLQGRHDQGPEPNARWFAEWDEVVAQLQAFQLTGDVLELAAGTGIWTQQLLGSASTITAVDASAEMLAVNQAKVGSPRVTYVLADLFNWQPERVYDALFFGFWLSHVPREQLDAFLRSCWTWLHPGGKIFFVDDTGGPTMAPDTPSRQGQIETRTLNDGRSFQIVKNYYEAPDLVAACVRAGFDIVIRQTATCLQYGFGTRPRSEGNSENLSHR
jgi:2-polyprenyl-3-methyl-5-hydroxy-6-metoxy-1,4-benzoquinol methylase